MKDNDLNVQKGKYI